MTEARNKPSLVQIDFSEAQIEMVMREYENENPGKDARQMTSGEFADKMMKKLIASATIIEGGNA